jgi:hypothetical protein
MRFTLLHPFNYYYHKNWDIKEELRRGSQETKTSTMKTKTNKLKHRLFAITLLFSASLNAQWTQVGNDIHGEAAGDKSGGTVRMSASGKTLAVGAFNNRDNAGHVRVYNWNGINWVQMGMDIDGESLNDRSGTSFCVSADGETVAIGAPNNEGNGANSGHVRIYNWDGTMWLKMGYDIDGENISDLSGSSVSLSADGRSVAIGAPNNSGFGTNTGHTRIYTWNDVSWTQLGSDIDGENASDLSGSSVSLSASGQTIAIGAFYNDGNGSNSGHVRIYTWNVATVSWDQMGSDIDGENISDLSGSSVSLSADGETLAIGAPHNDGNGSNSGHVRIYTWNVATVSWDQMGSDVDGENPSDLSGSSVSLSASGQTIAIGARDNSGTNGPGAGHTRIYTWNAPSWIKLGSDIDGENASDLSGSSVSMSADGKTVAIGAPSNAGYVRIYKFCEEITNTISPEVCGSYTVPSEDETYTVSGVYMDTIPTSDSCGDSVLTINLTINNVSDGTDIQISCEPFTWIDGNTYSSSNNTATFTISGGAANGCDSLVTLELTINNVSDKTTTTTGITISSNNTTATYSWLDCDDNYTEIPGATIQTFTPTSNGNYAVELKENGCTDTSECVTITTVGILENTLNKNITVYPNPSNGDFSIGLGSEYENAIITITNILGLEIYTTIKTQSKIINLNLNEPAGVYFISVETDDEKSVVQVIIE